MAKPVNMRAPGKRLATNKKRGKSPPVAPVAPMAVGERSEYDSAVEAAWEKVTDKLASVAAEGGVLAFDDPVWQECSAAVASAGTMRGPPSAII